MANDETNSKDKCLKAQTWICRQSAGWRAVPANLPDAEFAGTVEDAHHIEHAVVVAGLAVGDGGIPEGFDEVLGARVRGGEAGGSIGEDEAGLVGVADGGAV